MFIDDGPYDRNVVTVIWNWSMLWWHMPRLLVCVSRFVSVFLLEVEGGTEMRGGGGGCYYI